MPWIQNVSFDDVKKAWHYDPGSNSVLISIVDPDMENPVPEYPFGEIYSFKFLDIEEEDSQAITEKQAKQIAGILLNALKQNKNVVVHCVAGICRSGAVVEAAVSFLGFQDTETYRQPNLRVKKMILDALICEGV